MDKFINFLMKWPIKIILTSLIIIIVFAVGISKVTLETGNDTLLSDKTDIYKDNEAYQKEFGKEPIILLFKEEELFSSNTLFVMNELQEEISTLNGIYAINSPVTIINEISNNMYNETKNGLITLSENLITIGNNLGSNDISESVNFEMINTVLNGLITSQSNLSNGLDNIFTIVNMMETAVDLTINDLNNVDENIKLDNHETFNSILGRLNQIKISITNIKSTSDLTNIPNQTINVLNNMLNQFTSLKQQFDQMNLMFTELSQGLITMGNNLKQMSNNFNAFKPTFPKEEDTLNMMVNNASDKLDGFIVGERDHLRMVIVLDYDITDKEVDLVISKLFDKIEHLEVENQVLLSGKPVLDRSVKSSMMSSMAIMMASAVIIMMMILLIFYRVRFNLLPMFMMLLVVIATVGIMGWINVGMTMVSMAVFPILIGLGIDYFVQFQTRYEEECGIK